jgi:hypothetical protein
VWWESIQDATRPRIDLEQIRKRGDFLSEIVRVVESFEQDPDARARFVADAAAGLPLARLHGKIAELDADTLHDELDRAALLALELVEEEADS